MAFEHDTTTLPASWASALVNNDTSGLSDAETKRLIAAVDKLLGDGWTVVDTVADSERFTWYYRAYDPQQETDGGNVMDYVITRAKE
jgi:hypothetical protein